MTKALDLARVTRRAFFGIASAALLAFGGCVICGLPPRPLGGSEEAWKQIADGAPVRVAVYVDRGARGVGAFRWTQIVDQAEGI